MKKLRSILTAIVLSALTALSVVAESAAPPIQLALTLNDGTSRATFVGWPVVFRGDVVLTDEVSGVVALQPSTLALKITSASGQRVNWALRATADLSNAPALGPDNDAVRVTWVLPLEEAKALTPGSYVAEFSLAGITAAPLLFTVEPSPATLTADEEIRRAVLQSDAALLLGNTDEALTALAPMELKAPDAIPLLIQRAQGLIKRGDAAGAFASAQRALDVFYRSKPKQTHPPTGILEIEARARTELLKKVKPGPIPPGLPGGPPRTASTPPAPINVAAFTNPPAAKPSSSTATTPAPAKVEQIVATVGKAAAGTLVAVSELNEAKILADANGQWASVAKASSQYSAPNYGAGKLVGAPDVPAGGDHINAWCPSAVDGAPQWIEVGFAKSVQAVEVRVRQTYNPGAIVKVEAIDSTGAVHLWWEDVDPARPPGALNAIAWFAMRVPKTAYLVASVRITLNVDAVPSWQQIDAVQLVGAAP